MVVNDLMSEKRIAILASSAMFKSIFSKPSFAILSRNCCGTNFLNVWLVAFNFLFSSEVLFTSASAELGLKGKKQIRAVAEQLKKVTDKIPNDIKWILRVDGHTDSLPLISNSQYKDNWELSQARALAVVKFLIDEENFPPDKLAATGFGPHQPLNFGNTSEAFSQNRRIELKITEK